MPSLSEIIAVKDLASMATGKTVEDSKKTLSLYWRNLGRLCGLVVRCIRFAELEAKAEIDRDGIEGLTPDEKQEFFCVLMGRQWTDANQSRILAESPGEILSELLNQYIAPEVKTMEGMEPGWDAIAYAWSPMARIELKEGRSEGMASFQVLRDRERTYQYAWFQPRKKIGNSTQQLANWNAPRLFTNFTAKEADLRFGNIVLNLMAWYMNREPRTNNFTYKSRNHIINFAEAANRLRRLLLLRLKTRFHSLLRGRFQILTASMWRSSSSQVFAGRRLSALGRRHINALVAKSQ